MSPRLLLPALGILLFCCCNDDADGLFPDPLHPTQETFKSSLFLTITDTSGTPVRDAEVRIGSATGKTDEKGFIHFDRIKLGKSSYLTIEKDGFFHASRRFYPSKGVAENIHVTLLPISRKAFFSSSSGGNFVDDGLRISFPIDGYEFKNGDAYNGIVVVYSANIKGDDPDLSFKMPGDLVGIMINGSNVALASMGMFAVELRSTSGELLELKDGASAEVQMVVPSSLTNLPVSIPLWHFDESSGIWREEGQATLTGNTYTGNVSHFSYWNYDAWFPIVKWGMQLVYKDENAAPVAQSKVCITLIELNTTKCDLTNAEGKVCGMVAANELMLMDVYSICGSLEYSTVIGPFSDTTMLAPIYIEVPERTTVTGIGVDCEGKLVKNGYAIINNGSDNYAPLVNGTFKATLPRCNDQPMLISIVDVTTLKESKSVLFDSAPLINADTILACEDLSEYVIINLVGVQDPIVFTELGFRQSEEGFVLFIPKDSVDSFVYLQIDPLKLGVYTNYAGEIGLKFGDTYLSSWGLNLKLERFGEIGDYVQGQINGSFYKSQQTFAYNFTGSFSVLRDE